MAEETTVVEEAVNPVDTQNGETAEAPAAPAPKLTVEQLLAQRAELAANTELSAEEKDKRGRSIRRQLRAQGYSLRAMQPAKPAATEASEATAEVAPAGEANQDDETASAE